MVADDVAVAVDERPRYVSRGGIKLQNALDALGLDRRGRRCLDVGASTGGFTDCLLQRGAEHVVALDVAYGELDWSLRGDPRVTVFERSNARALVAGQLPYAPDLIIVGPVVHLAAQGAARRARRAARTASTALAMVKPQFEVGARSSERAALSRDPAIRAAMRSPTSRSSRRGVRCGRAGLRAFRAARPKGNLETFVCLAEAGREGALRDIASAAREAAA